MLRSIRRALKPNGQLVLLEYRKEDPKLPIHPNHKMSVSEVRTELEAEGLVFDRVLDGLPMQHILIFRSPTSGRPPFPGRWPQGALGGGGCAATETSEKITVSDALASCEHTTRPSRTAP